MELSLFSRDTIAMATAVALSHDVFDAALLLGVCDKIVPGLLIGALHFGHLPCVFVPAGPMTRACPTRQGQGARAGRRAWSAATNCWRPRSAAYHGPGTCTFYGTANSNQMLLEAMGLHLPGAAFVHPHAGLREALTREAVRTGAGDRATRPANASRPSAAWSTSAASSTRWSRCWPPAARPTT
jgi:phosphogluconate dehydratase